MLDRQTLLIISDALEEAGHPGFAIMLRQEQNCSTCLHWGKRYLRNYEARRCRRHELRLSGTPPTDSPFMTQGGSFYTTAEFSCTLWKGKNTQ